MKGTIARIVALVALVFAIGVQAQEDSQKISGSHLGTWKLVSFKYGTSQPAYSDVPESQQRIKLITETHFTWVQIDAATMKVGGAAGGTYSLSGNTYTESIDFGLGMDTYSGAKHTFTIRVEGDKFLLSGLLADGLKIEEVWQRVQAELVANPSDTLPTPDYFVALMKSDQPEQRVAGIKGYNAGGVMSNAGFHAVLACADDNDEQVRLAALQFLELFQKIIMADKNLRSPFLVAVAKLRQDPDPEIRNEAARAFSHIGTQYVPAAVGDVDR